ncbi:MAG: ABC transporter permease subunit, partial [Chromatiales bacterium]|nr:ABC transporter permease subunit [Chromatiales bacterium]
MRGLVLAAALVFLYLPMLLLIIYSFNESRLVTVWSGWSVKWYGELLRDQQMIGAIWMSLRIAFLAATAALVLGVLAGVALTRVGAFRGKALLGTMITAPLVIPEVITGLSLLLLFVALGQLIGWPAQRGMLTIWIAHVTFCTAYVTLIVAGRLSEFDHSIEEAAMDLGATPLRTFFQVTLPVISPALIAAWLLAFTLSLDDLVIASFVTGPGAST